MDLIEFNQWIIHILENHYAENVDVKAVYDKIVNVGYEKGYEQGCSEGCDEANTRITKDDQYCYYNND